MNDSIKSPHTITVDEVIKLSGSDVDKGLSSKEVKKRLEQFGGNIIEAGEKVSALKILFDNMNNIIVYLLMAATIVAFAMGDTVEGIAVIVAILIAVVSGFLSEYNAHKSIESLKSLVTTTVKVRRDSKIKEINSQELVVGDVVYIEEGDSITADARIFESKNFATIESALTGESEAIDKDEEYIGEDDTPVGDRQSMVFAGTAAARGNAYVLVTGTGMKSEIGKISSMLVQEKDTATPLEMQLNKLGRTLIIFSAIAALAVTIFGLLSGEETYTMIKLGIIFAISAVPEALPAVSTITLAIGMRNMAGQNALVKSLPAVETLGSTTVICTDKTGTLTENQMTVRKIVLDDSTLYEVTGAGYEPEGVFSRDDEKVDIFTQENVLRLIKAGVLSSNASLVQEDGQYKVIGDPTEGGIIVLGKKASVVRDQIEKEGNNRIGEIPFNSKEKFMATAYDAGDGAVIYIKGAPDILIQSAEEENKEALLELNIKLVNEGLRVLAVGIAENYSGDGSEESMRKRLDQGIKVLGLLGIIDPPREDVLESIKQSQDAGIRVIMITGDHPGTAKIIAGRIGMHNAENVITGREMDKMTDIELAEAIKGTSVFARVSPENKLQIVRALNIDNEVTAMTGDGVNDAPALKGADIGIAMGVRGTEVAKEASDMILTDDKFSTIIAAVKQGRIIFDNISKFVYFLFSCNVVEILTIFIAIIINLPMPVTALQLLWLNLVVDVLPAMSFAWESGEADIMKRKPRSQSDDIVNKKFLKKILGNGILIGLGSLFAFLYAYNSGYDEETARTIAFSTMAFGQLIHVLNVRDKDAFGLNKSLFLNKFMILALISSSLLQMLAVYLPFFNRVMGTRPLDLYQWIIVVLGAALPTVVIQIIRLLKKSPKTA